MLVKANAKRSSEGFTEPGRDFYGSEATENSASFKYSPYTIGNEETLLVLITEQSKGKSQNKVKPVNQP